MIRLSSYNFKKAAQECGLSTEQYCGYPEPSEELPEAGVSEGITIGGLTIDWKWIVIGILALLVIRR